MPLSPSIPLLSQPKDTGVVFPAGVSSEWVDCITAGGVTVQDAAAILNPDTTITAATRRILKRQKISGTYLVFRLGYNAGITGVTAPVLAVFGRTGTQPWQRLKNRSSARTLALTPAPSTDNRDASLAYTEPDIEADAFDMCGCDEFLVGLETALAATGTTSTAIIQAKSV